MSANPNVRGKTPEHRYSTTMIYMIYFQNLPKLCRMDAGEILTSLPQALHKPFVLLTKMAKGLEDGVLTWQCKKFRREPTVYLQSIYSTRYTRGTIVRARCAQVQLLGTSSMNLSLAHADWI